jgi:hypothetical protein
MVYTLYDHFRSEDTEERGKKTMSEHWILSDLDLMRLQMALQTDIHATEQSHDLTDLEKQELVSNLSELADRIRAIRDAFRKDVDSDGRWSERDQAMIRIAPKPGDELYTVVPWGLDRWVIVEKDNPSRPINEHIYTQKTHAYRKKRELNKAARQMNEIMAANGGALIL